MIDSYNMDGLSMPQSLNSFHNCEAGRKIKPSPKSPFQGGFLTEIRRYCIGTGWGTISLLLKFSITFEEQGGLEFCDSLF
jgi:hypothetical protein